MKLSYFIALLVSTALLVGLFFMLSVSGSSLVLDVAGQTGSDTPISGAGLLGNRLPYFDLPNLAGDHVKSTDFTDTPLIVVFWSTWNAEAADQMHILDQYLVDVTAQSRLVKVVAIDSQEERSVVASFMKRGGYEVQTLLDTQGRTSETYSIKSVPTFYFVDRTGIVREIHVGIMSQATLMNTVEKIVQ